MITFDLPSPARAKDGGVAYFSHELANRLCERGHEVVVVSLDPAPPLALYKVVRVPFARLFLRSRLLRYYVAPAVARFMTWPPSEVVHSHGGTWCFFGFPIPVIRSFYGSSLDEAIHATSWIRKINHLVLYLLEVISGWAADRVTAISKSAARRLPMPCVVIPCAVDTSLFRPGAKSEAPSILFVGTLHGRKRGQLLLEAYRDTVVRQYPNAELWMVCGESGPVVPGVRWLPKLTTTEIADFYRRAWIFCLPSSYEGFGVPYIEAMASGTPVVTTENEGANELLGGQEAGWIIRETELGGALIELLGDSRTRERFALAGRASALAFSWEAVIGSFEELYGQLVARKTK